MIVKCSNDMEQQNCTSKKMKEIPTYLRCANVILLKEIKLKQRLSYHNNRKEQLILQLVRVDQLWQLVQRVQRFQPDL